jgi:hypothetical protein
MNDAEDILNVEDKEWINQYGQKSKTFQPLIQGKEPGSVELDMEEPDDYDFEKRMKEEPIQGARFLPVPTHTEIVQNIFKVFSKIYNGIKSRPATETSYIPNGVSVAFSITYLFMLGSNFIQNLFSFLSSLNDVTTNFTTTSNPSYMFFTDRKADEEEHEYSDRRAFREFFGDKDSRVKSEIELNDIESIKRILFYQDVESFNSELSKFLGDLKKNNPLSENLESFLQNGVVVGRSGISSYDHILLTHNFKANRSVGDGAPIYKLLSEILGSKDMVAGDQKLIENINNVLSSGEYNNLLETISNLFILWNYLNNNLYEKIYQMNTTMSAAEIRKQKGLKEMRWSPGEASKSIISVKLGIPQFLLQHVYSIIPKGDNKILERDLLSLIVDNEEKESQKEEGPLSQGFYEKPDNTIEINAIFKKYTNKSLLELLSEVKKPKPKSTKKTKKSVKKTKAKPTISKTKSKGKGKAKAKAKAKASFNKKNKKRKSKKKREITVGDIIIKYN